MMMSSTVQADTRVVPSLNLSVGYDSNPWFGQAPPGKTDYDFFTNVTPAVNVQHRGKLAEGSFTGQVMAGLYAINPEINYFSTSAQMNFRLDRLVQTLNRNLTLSVMDSFWYTPMPPAFINPQAGQNPVSTQSGFGSGIQSYRVNTIANTAMINAGYLLSPQVSLAMSYTNTYISFGATSGDPTLGSVFGTIAHAIYLGPVFQVSPRDTVSLNYTYSTATFSGGGQDGTFETHGGQVTWQRLLTRTLTGSLTGGVSSIASGSAQVSPAQPTGGQPETLQQGGSFVYVGGASLLWNFRKETALTLAYNRSVVPSYAIASAPLVSDMVTLVVTHTFTAKLTALASANYALNRAPAAVSSDLGDLSFTSYGLNASLNYSLTRNMSALVTYYYLNFDQQFSGEQFGFNRNMIMVGLTYTWN
jgi:hypothetical protein